MNTVTQVTDFNSFGYLPKSWTVGSYKNCLALRNCQDVVYCGYTIWHPHQYITDNCFLVYQLEILKGKKLK